MSHCSSDGDLGNDFNQAYVYSSRDRMDMLPQVILLVVCLHICKSWTQQIHRPRPRLLYDHIQKLFLITIAVEDCSLIIPSPDTAAHSTISAMAP
mmetsp:Transcript_15376/g.25082  ORF Transcript_15376/g.25082 Transcript_15376/m.25082 type:complete len:95 (+) Transcript_15376:1220-1504(+)